jgi:hypothetical protein
MMANPAFVITIDTEGDDVWGQSSTVTTENVRFLPRFHDLCRNHGFPPTYLTNYEMAVDPRYQEFGRSVLRAREAEIGLHVHPWNSPPLASSGPETRGDHVYLFELSDDLLRAKIQHLTGILRDVFEIQPTSHRAGRWGFDERVARALVEAGYLVDCSVTPGISWKHHKGASDGGGGTDYTGFPEDPYFLDLDDIRRRGTSPMLEVPVTIRAHYPATMRRIRRALKHSRAGKLIRRFWGAPLSWMRPNGENLDSLLSLVDWAFERNAPVIEFALHSSELMPGGSPTFQTSEQIEVLYAHLEKLFAHLAARGARGLTLSQFRMDWRAD